MALLLSSRLTVRPRALPPIRFPTSRSRTSANIRLYRSYSIRSLQLTRPTFCSARWIPAATYRRIKVETLDTTSLIANRVTLSTYLRTTYRDVEDGDSRIGWSIGEDRRVWARVLGSQRSNDIAVFGNRFCGCWSSLLHEVSRPVRPGSHSPSILPCRLPSRSLTLSSVFTQLRLSAPRRPGPRLRFFLLPSWWFK